MSRNPDLTLFIHTRIIYAMKFKLALGFVFLSFAVCATVRTVTDLPPSPYADTEVSSNVVFNATRSEGQM